MELINKLKEYNILHPGMQILDVGCWDGKYSKILAEFGQVDALDIIDKVEDKSGINFIQENLRFFNTDKKYDLIFARNVFFITKDPIAHAKRYAGFLKQGGVFCLTFMGMNDPWIVNPVQGISRWAVTREQVEEFIQPFETIYFSEENDEHTTKGGNLKKWHLYYVILKKK